MHKTLPKIFTERFLAICKQRSISKPGEKIPKALVFYPNIGKTWNGVTHTWEEPTVQPGQENRHEHFWVKEIHQTVLDSNYDLDFYVGGCCGTNPEGIARLVQFMREEGMEITC